jgi:hypothetical protein
MVDSRGMIWTSVAGLFLSVLFESFEHFNAVGVVRV